MSSKRRRRHSPEQIVRKLRDADAMLGAGKDLALVLQSLEVSESTLERWRRQYGGMKAEEGIRVKQLGDENKKLKRSSRFPSEGRVEWLVSRVRVSVTSRSRGATKRVWCVGCCSLRVAVRGLGIGGSPLCCDKKVFRRAIRGSCDCGGRRG